MTNLHSDTLLCVDDDANMPRMFERKHKVLTASSGEQALAVLTECSDIAAIVSDYNMPGMDGVELFKRALEISPDSVQIMLTGNLDLEVSIKAINETAIFRYLPKPCPAAVLQKVAEDALKQYHLLSDKRRVELELKQKNRELAASNAALEKQKYLLELELEMAKTVYGNVVSHQHEQLDGLDYINVPKQEVGGDFLLTYTGKHRKSFYLMLGDLTGHGLQSALAVLLVAECFELNCQSQPDLESLAMNINAKMRAKLPIGLFCAATLIKLDLIEQRLMLWTGGMPEGYFLDAGGRIVDRMASANLPLGVCGEQNFAGTSFSYPIADVHGLFLHTDGVSEQINLAGRQFDEPGLQNAIEATPAELRRVDIVMTRLRQHRQQQEQSDDISLLELNLPRICKALEQ